MKINSLDLCYSLNVFPTVPDIEARLKDINAKFRRIRDGIGLPSSAPFALGFWADHSLVSQMRREKALSLVRRFLDDNSYYVFTLNAFPYGEFHSKPVKTDVYKPDWTTAERRDFTCNAADFLAAVMPKDSTGSISTLPGGYRKFLLHDKSHEPAIAANLVLLADHLARIRDKTGRDIVLGIEMEPDCIWDDVPGFLQFFDKYLRISQNATRHIGVCYDTSHQELTGTPPGKGLELLELENVRIAKIQLSAAIETRAATTEDLQALQPFSDKVYLHQTRFIDAANNILQSFEDIPKPPVANFANPNDGARLVSHFHVPVFSSEIGPRIHAATGELSAALDMASHGKTTCRSLEIETYTYSVLPARLRGSSIEQGIAEEFKWVLNHLPRRPLSSP